MIGGGGWSYQSYITTSHVASYLSRDYLAGDFYSSQFGVGDRDGKVGVVPRTTHISSQKVGFWIDGGNFVSY